MVNGNSPGTDTDALITSVVTKQTVTGTDVPTPGLALSSTTLLDESRGLPTSIEDANGAYTKLKYDSLGRLTEV